jgi:VanZ family protein
LRQLVLGGIGFTLLLEISQVPLTTRHARLSDFLVDTLAVWLGLFVGHLFEHLSQRIRAG